MSKYKRFYKNKWIIAALLFVLIVILLNLQVSPGFTELFYSQGLYRVISSALHLALSWIPISIGDLLYIAIILYVLYALFKFFKTLFKGRLKVAGTMLLRGFIYFETFIIAFYLFWGLNYFRPSAGERLGLQDTSYTLNDVKTVTRLLVDSVNATRAALNTADLQQPNKQIYYAAENAVKQLSKGQNSQKAFRIFMPAVKPSLITPLLNYLSTSGYYNPFTAEAQINWQMPVFDRPFTACHEMSHQIGFGREDEANFSGYLAGIHSPDKLLKYSAYYEGSIEFLRYLHRRDSIAHHQLKAMLSKAVKHDIKTDSLYWTGYESRLGLMSGLFYDRFLKANNQPAGLRTYNRMIRLTMAWYKKKGVKFEKPKDN